MRAGAAAVAAAAGSPITASWPGDDSDDGDGGGGGVFADAAAVVETQKSTPSVAFDNHVLPSLFNLTEPEECDDVINIACRCQHYIGSGTFVPTREETPMVVPPTSIAGGTVERAPHLGSRE